MGEVNFWEDGRAFSVSFSLPFNLLGENMLFEMLSAVSVFFDGLSEEGLMDFCLMAFEIFCAGKGGTP